MNKRGDMGEIGKFWILCFALALSASVARAEDPADVDPTQGKSSSQPVTGPRKKSIDFEEGVVEGLNRSGKESATQVGAQTRRLTGHLYKKRTEFREETGELYREMGYTR